jgi:YVTN family beta-propeller protein
VVVNPGGTRVYVANGDDGSISVVDTTTLGVVATVAVGSYPLGLASSPDGRRIYVANGGADTVSVVDTASLAVVATVTVGLEPTAPTVDETGSRLYVTIAREDEVAVVDTASLAVVGRAVVGDSPQGLALTPDGTSLYVANQFSNSVSVVSTATLGLVATVAVGAGPQAYGQFIQPPDRLHGSCVPNGTTLCLDDQPGDRRFAVQVDFETAQAGGLSGAGNAIALSSLGVNQGGLFWFFGQGNPELLVKVLNGCSLNQKYWVFFSAGTNVGLTLTVTDTVTGETYQRTNPDLRPVPTVQDASALPCDGMKAGS